jgi:diguanylate cyclase (GGDEF)-like protein/PAS domain S-box-containing protein
MDDRLVGDSEAASQKLARRGLSIAAIICLAGSILALVGIRLGAIAGADSGLILAGFFFALGLLATLLGFRNVPPQPLATALTVFATAYLSAGFFISGSRTGAATDFLNAIVYLLWFFPLMCLNKLINAPAVGRRLARLILVTPIVAIGCMLPGLIATSRIDPAIVLVAFALSYAGHGFMLHVVTRYREKYIIERERAESLKIESAVLESISDCFISLDRDLKLVYLNDAACAEFGVDRRSVLHRTIESAVPNFFSHSIEGGVRSAYRTTESCMFEAQNHARDRWFEMRCYPRPDGMSVYFRNITEAMSSRRDLERAHTRLREQAELLDKAQDAIVVQDMDGAVIYWNKGAERLYGWTAPEVMGRSFGDVVPDARASANAGALPLLAQGDWNGELAQCRRDGSALVVQSRRTLVKAEDGTPRSILAINTDITERKAAEAAIERLAFYDFLTELPNRRLLRTRLDDALARSFGEGSFGALLFIDLDDFKTLNDTLGHNVGDVLLQQVALRLVTCVRESDTVARLGGDEFVVMLEDLSRDSDLAAEEARAFGDRVLEAFVQPFHVGGRVHNASVSVGIAMFAGAAEAGEMAVESLKRADIAMYHAKARGRNVVCFFDPTMETLVAARAALQSDLRRALRERQFQLHYQPQMDRNGNVICAEALLRWPHPERGHVPPTEFIALAEESGLIVDVGRWVLETACAQLAAWSAAHVLKTCTIAVNVSLRQFLDPNFVDIVLDVLRASGADPSRLKLELTESSMMENPEDTIVKMALLKRYGVGFSLDDFGTGYSSLSYLKRLPLDQIKIDRSFVNDVLTDSRDASIVRAIVALGRSLDLTIVAEGVENEGQREFLEREGCDAFQGYLFSPALKAPEFEAFTIAAFASRARMTASCVT